LRHRLRIEPATTPALTAQAQNAGKLAVQVDVQVALGRRHHHLVDQRADQLERLVPARFVRQRFVKRGYLAAINLG
jgi:hypothetical protein